VAAAGDPACNSRAPPHRPSSLLLDYPHSYKAGWTRAGALFGLIGLLHLAAMPSLQSDGAIVGASVSGLFLWLIGLLNRLVHIGIVRVWREMRLGTYKHQDLEELLAQRGWWLPC
jgi:hypothetical protein